jgi:hypothetical protein
VLDELAKSFPGDDLRDDKWGECPSLARGDSRGLSNFYVVFGVVLGGFLLGQTLPALK